MQDLRTLVASVPPIAEQDQVILHIYRASAQLDSAIRDADILMALLKERRSALISAAVTGKIDVRSVVTERKAA
jgi:type I restriction enzyme S subunit